MKYIITSRNIHMPRKKSKVPLERVSLRFPSELLVRMDRLIERGLFKSRSHLVKEALKELLKDPKYREALREEEDDFPTLRGR
ncbi:CopG family transcriptional regulator [Pyrobaculum aerophilum]|uniref:CopG family transcriptional regulator n=2 Tax=Pyrobaculum aerophilum TaxID=13773 RepID=A0A371QWF2_9CREN|nr:CopG family transcriptional regulator [Pyrobaculum aerophilum]RFB00274.1 CopG family transcriptional regulator [Pyrobaculum aerophilum]